MRFSVELSFHISSWWGWFPSLCTSLGVQGSWLDLIGLSPEWRTSGSISVSKRPPAGFFDSCFRLKRNRIGFKTKDPRSTLRFLRERLPGPRGRVGRPFLCAPRPYPFLLPPIFRSCSEDAFSRCRGTLAPLRPRVRLLFIGPSFPFQLEAFSLSNPGSFPFEVRLARALMAKRFGRISIVRRAKHEANAHDERT